MKSLVSIASLALVCVLQLPLDAQAGGRRRCCCFPPANGAAAAAAAGAAVTPAAAAAAAGGTLTGDINPNLLNGTSPGPVGTNPPAGQTQGLWNPVDLGQVRTWREIALLQGHLKAKNSTIKGFDLTEATLRTVTEVPDAP